MSKRKRAAIEKELMSEEGVCTRGIVEVSHLGGDDCMIMFLEGGYYDSQLIDFDGAVGTLMNAGELRAEINKDHADEIIEEFSELGYKVKGRKTARGGPWKFNFSLSVDEAECLTLILAREARS